MKNVIHTTYYILNHNHILNRITSYISQMEIKYSKLYTKELNKKKLTVLTYIKKWKNYKKQSFLILGPYFASLQKISDLKNESTN